VLFFAIVAVGSVNKEVILALAPLCPLLCLVRYGSLRSRSFWLAVAGVLAVFAAYGLYRHFAAQAIGPASQSAMLTAYGRTRFGTVLDAIENQKGIYELFGVFHFLWLLFAFLLYRLHARDGWRTATSWLRST